MPARVTSIIASLILAAISTRSWGDSARHAATWTARASAVVSGEITSQHYEHAVTRSLLVGVGRREASASNERPT